MSAKRSASIKSVAKASLYALAGCSAGLWPLLAPAADPGGLERAGRVATLMAQAKQALQQDRLTVPSGNNAVAYAQQVLDLDPKNPDAQQILRNVVARYGNLGERALDRAAAIKAREMGKVQTYQTRGERVVTRYQLPDPALRQVDERLASLDPSHTAGRVPEQHPMGRQALMGAVTRYTALSEAALNRGDVPEAQHYRNVAADLVSHYQLPDPGLSELTQRVAQAEQARKQKPDATEPQEFGTAATKGAPGFASKEPPVFLPPSF